MNFGDIIWIVVLLLATFGGSITKLLRSANQEDADTSAQPASHPVWEAEGYDTVEMPLDDEEASETMDDAYFTYEDVRQEYHAPVPQHTACAPSPAVSAVRQEEEQPMSRKEPEAFDLRKAVIYQTILQNDYLND